jgi:hypothetical protein
MLKEREDIKERNRLYFKSKETIDQLTEENYHNSVFISTLGKLKVFRPG